MKARGGSSFGESGLGSSLLVWAAAAELADRADVALFVYGGV